VIPSLALHNGCHSSAVLIQTGMGSTSRAIAHRKAASSRAMAVIVTVLRFPFAMERRYRAQRRPCAFQAMSRTCCGSFCCRR
jgi:hypothetical protein